jgi:predicted small lipoprotein YifL
MRRIALVALLALAACGADGPPVAPAAGVTVGGEARAGVVIGG